VEWFGLNTASSLEGAFVFDGNFAFIFDEQKPFLKLKNFHLPGEHNARNALAASLVARFLGLSNKQIARKVSSFKSLPYRLELTAKFKKTKFYNDSQATSPEAAKAAIESFPNYKKIVIAGGKAKIDPTDFDSWIEALINNKVKMLLLIGEASEQIEKEIFRLKKKVPFALGKCDNMEDAVAEAFANIQNVDIILMSPACESFGEFADYRERGRRFDVEVKKNIKKYKF